MEEIPAEAERVEVGTHRPDRVERRLVLRLLGHWRTLCGDRKMPALPELEPADIPEMWPHSFLVKIDQASGQHVFQALGEQLDAPSSPSLVGKQINEADTHGLPGMALA